MNITILGWYGHGNTGDEAYKAAFPVLFPGHSTSFVDRILPEHEADLVILGGGDVLYPDFTRQLDRVPAARRWLMSATLTPNSDVGVLESFERVYVRDLRSLAHAPSRASYQPDVTFLLEPDPKGGRERLEEWFDQAGHVLKSRVVVVVISNYLMHSHRDALARDHATFLKFSQDVAFAADSFEDVSFVFLPFCTMAPHDDRTANSWVAARCGDYRKNLVVWESSDISTTIDVISASDAVVSSRLHASVFATISSVPFIDVTHHDKTLGYVETLGKTDWSIPFWEFDVGRYRTLLRSFLDTDSGRAELRAFTESSREALGNVALS